MTRKVSKTTPDKRDMDGFEKQYPEIGRLLQTKAAENHSHPKNHLPNWLTFLSMDSHKNTEFTLVLENTVPKSYIK